MDSCVHCKFTTHSLPAAHTEVWVRVDEVDEVDEAVNKETKAQNYDKRSYTRGKMTWSQVTSDQRVL